MIRVTKVKTMLGGGGGEEGVVGEGRRGEGQGKAGDEAWIWSRSRDEEELVLARQYCATNFEEPR